LEDVQVYTDAQIGQAVREVHKKAQAALRQHAVIEPVLAGKEDEAVTVPKGFDPSAIRVIELGLDHDAPFAVLEEVGATTLAMAVGAAGPSDWSSPMSQMVV